jgi:hypothetical protein
MRRLFLCASLLALAAAPALAAPVADMDKVPVTKPESPKEDILGTLDCTGAIEMQLGGVDVPVTYAGTNVGAPNNVTFYGCSGWNESGGEVVYHLYLPEPKNWEASIAGATCDLDLAVLDLCDEVTGCLIVVDSGVYTNSPVSGDFYFVVDGYAGAACRYVLTITEKYTPPPPPPACDEVVPLSCEDLQLAGDTCDSWNFISSEACIPYTEGGLEDWYEITLEPGGSFAATVTYDLEDGALWVMDSCDPEVWTCLVGADDTLDGEAEVVAYENETGVQQTVYLVIDAWGTNACGTYTGSFTCSGGVIANMPASWGSVKDLYR